MLEALTTHAQALIALTTAAALDPYRANRMSTALKDYSAAVALLQPPDNAPAGGGGAGNAAAAAAEMAEVALEFGLFCNKLLQATKGEGFAGQGKGEAAAGQGEAAADAATADGERFELGMLDAEARGVVDGGEGLAAMAVTHLLQVSKGGWVGGWIRRVLRLPFVIPLIPTPQSHSPLLSTPRTPNPPPPKSTHHPGHALSKQQRKRGAPPATPGAAADAEPHP